MARSIAWSPEAVEDIEAIAEYIQRDSPWYAQAVLSRILDTVSGIPEQPEIGRIVPEIDDEKFRERFVYSYRLIYRIEPQQILIAAVIHGRRLLEPLVARITER